MSREALVHLVNRWLNEPEFREELREEPQETLERHGYTRRLDDEERKAILAADWELSDAELLIERVGYH